MLHRTVLPANLIIMIIGFSMFTEFQTIPILVKNPPPLGFGEDAVSTGGIQLPAVIKAAQVESLFFICDKDF